MDRLLAGRLTALGCIVLAASACEAEAAPFRNLDFELATPDDPLPHWSVDELVIGPNYDNACMGHACLGVYSDAPQGWWSPPMQGSHHLYLTGGFVFVDENYEFIPAGIWQIGDVPSDAQSLRLLSWRNTWGNLDAPIDLRVYLNDIPAPLETLGEAAVKEGRALQLAANVAAFAGMTDVTLRIATKTPVPPQNEVDELVDDVTFSPLPSNLPAANDFDADGVIGGGDLLGWQRVATGAAWSGAALDLWARDFGLAGTPTPEPTGAALLLVGAWGVGRPRRRSASRGGGKLRTHRLQRPPAAQPTHDARPVVTRRGVQRDATASLLRR